MSNLKVHEPEAARLDAFLPLGHLVMKNLTWIRFFLPAEKQVNSDMCKRVEVKQNMAITNNFRKTKC